MSRLEELVPGARIQGAVADRTVRVVGVKWHGDSAVTLTWADDLGGSGSQLLERDDEAHLVVERAPGGVHGERLPRVPADAGDGALEERLAALGMDVTGVVDGRNYRQWLFAERSGGQDGVLGWLSIYDDGSAGLTVRPLVEPGDPMPGVRRVVRAVPDPVTGGRFEIIDDERGEDTVRLVHRFPASMIDEEPDRFSSLFHLARFTIGAVDWWGEPPRRGTKAYDSLTNTLVGSGLAVPPVPRAAKPLCHLGPWSWGTVVAPPFAMYTFQADMFIDWWDRRPAFALCHAGHGINSYGLNLFFAGGPVACFVQYGWGGAYSDRHRDAGAIAQGFSRIRALPVHEDGEDDPRSRYLLLYSEFRGAAAVVDLDSGQPVVDLNRIDFESRCDVEESLFAAAEELID